MNAPTPYLIATLPDLASAKTHERRKTGNAAFVPNEFDLRAMLIAARLDESNMGAAYLFRQRRLDADFLRIAAGLNKREAALLPQE